MKINVPHIAKLANLSIKNDNLKILEAQLSSILDYIEKLKEIDTKNIGETNQVTGLRNVTREDKTSPSFSQEEALSNAKDKHNGLFKIKAIFE